LTEKSYISQDLCKIILAVNKLLQYGLQSDDHCVTYARRFSADSWTRNIKNCCVTCCSLLCD